MKKSLIALVAFAALFFLAACATPVESINLSATQVSLRVGETLQVNATVSPADADFDGFTWSSANTSIVTVNQTGLLTAVGAGTTSVTVAAGDRTGFVQVTVQARPADPDPVDPVDPTPEPEPDPVAIEVQSLVSEITVDFGTPLADVVALFPSTATVVADNGETFEVTLRWIVYEYRADFDPEATSRYVASGLFTLPSGLVRGSIRTQIDTFVTVLPAAVRIALDVINFTPQLATVADFSTAGVQGVTVNNLVPIRAALVAAKGTTEFPDWSASVLQGVIDPLLASFVGTVFETPAPSLVWDLTVVFDSATPVGIELRNGSEYRFFTDVQVNELLWNFISENATLLNNQRVSFEFKAINTFSSLLGPDRLTYLELRRDVAENLEIPNLLLFNELIIDGQDFEIGNLTINAQNVVVRNLEVADLTLQGQARTTTLANVVAEDILIETVLVSPTLRLNDVSFTGTLENRATLLSLVGPLTAGDAAVSISGSVIGLNLVAGATASVVTLEAGANLEDSEFGARLTVLVAAAASLDNAEFNGDVLSANPGGVLTLTGLIELNGNDFNLTGSSASVKLDGAQVYNAIFVDGDVLISKVSEIWNSTIGAVLLDVNANLVMVAPSFTATESAVDVATKVTLTLVSGSFTQSNTLTVATPGSIVFGDSATISTGKTLTFSGSGLVSGLENLNILLISDKLMAGQSLSTNITGNAVAFQWQTATGAGVYANAATSPAFSATDIESIRLVLEFVNTDTLITLSAVGPFDANTINITASSVSIDSSFVAAASGENVEFDLVVKTENGYDLLSPSNVDVLISSASLTITLTNKVITTGGIVQGIAVNITKAGAYSNLEVYVSGNGVSTFTRVGTVSTSVVASTPVSISVVSSKLISASAVGKGTSNEIVVLVSDVNGNPVNGAILSLGVTGVGLEATTRFTSSTATTNVSGQATLVLNTAANQINPITLSVTGATITSSELEGDVLDLVRVVNNVNSSASMADTTVTVGSITFVVNLADGEQSGLPVVAGDYVVRLVNQAGSVVASTTVTISSGQTTVAAIFTVITAAAYNVDVHVAAYPSSSTFVNVQDNYAFTLNADVFNTIVITGLTTNDDLALGSSNTVTVSTQDQHGNPVGSVAVTYSATLASGFNGAGFGSSGNITIGSITTNVNGTATLDLRVASGLVPANDRFDLVFTATGATQVNLSGIDIFEETIPANSTAVISTLTPSSITAGNTNLSVLVTLNNASPSAMANGTYDVQLVLANGVTQATTVAISNGTGTAQFTITQAGNYVGAKLLAEKTLGSNELVEIATLGNFTIIPTTSITSTITISPLLTSTAIRGNLYAITVTAVDSEGNKLTGVTISAVLTLIDGTGFRDAGTGFASSLGSVFSASSVTSFNTSTTNGEAVIFVKISASETLSLGNKYTLTITAAQGSSAVATDSDTFRIIAE